VLFVNGFHTTNVVDVVLQINRERYLFQKLLKEPIEVKNPALEKVHGIGNMIWGISKQGGKPLKRVTNELWLWHGGINATDICVSHDAEVWILIAGAIYIFNDSLGWYSYDRFVPPFKSIISTSKLLTFGIDWNHTVYHLNWEEKTWTPFSPIQIKQLSVGKDGQIWAITLQGSLLQCDVEIPQWTSVDDLPFRLSYINIYNKNTIIVRTVSGQTFKYLGSLEWKELLHFHQEHAKQVVVGKKDYKMFFWNRCI